jgi:hypothetical protein
MRYYKCDGCGHEFDPADGMVDSWYIGSRLVQWTNPDRSVERLRVEKTMKVYRHVEWSDHSKAHDKEIKIDLCRSCVMKFEKP